MVKCESCGEETHTAIYKPASVKADGYFKLLGPLCRRCSDGTRVRVAPEFYFVGGSPTAGPSVEPTTSGHAPRPKTVGTYYGDGMKRSNARFDE